MFFLKIIMIISTLISVAFITLVERKILSYIHYRKGPNKLALIGILQPIADAIKLFSKMKLFLNFFNSILYFSSPILALTLMLFLWSSIHFNYFNFFTMNYEMIFILVISSMNIYTIIFAGWSSNSKYAILGSYRGIAQSISYEVSFSFIIISIFIFMNNLNFNNFYFIQIIYFFFSFLPIFFLWFLTILAETNRTPFDLTEGESELVSGFNIEFSGIEFAIIFMAEYGNILFMSLISSILFLGGNNILIFIKIMFFSILFLIIRGTLVRMRYDKLMFLSWKSILPNSIFFLIFFFMIFYY
uniref:NADH-ubiquinone oxidoreductase chain 1 n=1 Tax=Echinolaelaps echidninus TaxID=2759148 RepID=A0AB74RXR3_9ACAR